MILLPIVLLFLHGPAQVHAEPSTIKLENLRALWSKKPEEELFVLHVETNNHHTKLQVKASKVILASGAYVNINSLITHILPDHSALFFPCKLFLVDNCLPPKNQYNPIYFLATY